MTATVNRQIRLAARPVGLPKNSDWELTEEPVAEPGPGEVLVRVRYISVDPAMRGWMNDRPSYVPPVAIGAVMRALTVGEVVASNSDDLATGDFVAGIGGVQDYALSDGSDLMKVDPDLAPLPTWLSTLGIAGLTAYCGLVEVSEPKTGETVVVSGAAGSVGAHVGQIAKIKGCRAVGIAGGPEKCRYLTDELGFDAAIDYKAEGVAAGLKRACAGGIDVFFDNVGGVTLDAALARMNVFGRVALCGAISQYNATGPLDGLRNVILTVPRRLRLHGFIYFDFRDKWPAMLEALAAWRAEGRLNCREDIVEGGIAKFPETLLRLFRGDNFGKLMIEVAE
jgi:NADPH-dependent curcumin reductase CurA